MIEINLLPEQLRPRAQTQSKKPPALAPVPKAFPMGLAGLTVLMGLLVVVSSTRAGSSQSRVRQIQRELQQAKTKADEAARVSADFPETEARYIVLADRLDGKIEWAGLLRALSLRCPSHVVLTSIKIERDRRTNQPVKLVVSGAYEGESSLEMQFADGLKASGIFATTFESVIPEKNLEPDGRTAFSLVCSFRPRADELLDSAGSASPTEKVTSP